MLFGLLPASATTSSGTKVADGDTSTSWQQMEADVATTGTKYIGRIWTDKSVTTGTDTASPNSDFNVALSALSSTSNLQTVTSSDVPLDIVLVVDVSSSMGDEMDSSVTTTYTAVDWSTASSSITDEYYVNMGTESSPNWIACTAYYVKNATIREPYTYYTRWGSEVRWRDNGSYSGVVYRFSYNGSGYCVYNGGIYVWNTYDNTLQHYTSPYTSVFDGHTQLYKASNTRMEALKNAVNSFVDSVDTANNTGIHRISIVQFAGDAATSSTDTWYCNYNSYNTGGQIINYSKTVLDYTAVTSDSTSTIKSAVNGLAALGGTQAQNGLSSANQLIQNATSDTSRADSEKVVIYFSDGMPGDSGFEADVAQSALTNAKNIKDLGATVYSIGVFDDANTSSSYIASSNAVVGSQSDAINANSFMHGVSSNYASGAITDSTSRYWPYTTTYYWSLGDRTTDSAYYMTASDSSGLSNVFSQIFDQINHSSGTPTYIDTAGGFDATSSGYVTFTDQLDEYMQVDGISSITLTEPYEYTGASSSGNPITFDFSDSTATITGPAKSDGSTSYTVDEFKSSTTAGTYTIKYTATADKYKTHYTQETATGDPADIVIEVVRGSSLQAGDEITVKIPASCLPLVELRVEGLGTDTTSYTVYNTDPIKVNYGVSLKSSVEELVNQVVSGAYDTTNTDAVALASWINTNKSNGTISFLSNDYSGSKNAAETSTVGDTTSTFMPATSNSFYYFTEDTQLFTRTGGSGTQDDPYTYAAVASTDDINENTTYYYKHAYYVADENGGVVLAPEADQYVAVNGKYLTSRPSDEQLVQKDDGVYIAAGSHRLAWVMSLEAEKDTDTVTNNKTNTADTYISPSWDYTSTPVSSIINKLGNNGKLTLELPATLAISKTVQAADGFALPSGYADKAFQMKITLKDANGAALTTTSSYQIAVKKTDGTFTEAVSKDFVNGVYTYDTGIKHGETLYVYGLPAGYSYTVEETSGTGDGYSNITKASSMTGNLSADTVSTVSVVNEYKANSTTTADSAIKLTKNYSMLASVDTSTTPYIYPDDAWDSDAYPDTGTDALSFTMCLEAVSFTNVSGTTMTDATQLSQLVPAPSSAGTSGWTTPASGNPYTTISVNKDSKIADFGTITFTVPGTYVFNLHEEADSLAGISYGGDRYRVTVVVEDNGDGTMKNTVTTEQIADASGESQTAAAITNGSAVAHNLYSETQADLALYALKALTDNSGSKTLGAGDFSFKIELGYELDTSGGKITEGVPQPVGADNVATYTKESVGNDDTGRIGFGGVQIGSSSIGKTYFYEFYEIVPDGVDSNNTLNGMTYDTTRYRAKVVVGSQTGATSGSVVITVTTTYQKQNADSTWTDITGTPTFNNEYNVTQTSLAAGFNVQKTLAGRDAADGESFTFTATLTGQPSTNSVKANESATTYYSVNDVVSTLTMTQGSGTGQVDLNDSVSVTKAIAEGITFTKPGTYVFEIKETQPTTGSAGTTYDNHTSTVTVRVVDNNGQLEITDITTGDGVNGESDGVAYDNSKATGTYTTVTRTFTKTGENEYGEDTGYWTETSTEHKDSEVQNAAAFTNTFTQNDDLTGVNATFKKSITGRGFYQNEFSFTLTARGSQDADGTYDASGADHTFSTYNSTNRTYTPITVTSGSASTGAATNTIAVSIGNQIKFTQDDLGQTFFYKVEEVIPDDAVAADGTLYKNYTPSGNTTKDFTYKGVTYTANAYVGLVVQVCYDTTNGLYLKVGSSYDWDYTNHTWKASASPVSTANNGTGTVALKNYVSGYDTLANVYTESGSGTATAYKQLLGREWISGDSFSFVFVPLSNTAGLDTSGMPMPSGSQTVTTPSGVEVLGKTYTLLQSNAEAAKSSTETTTEGIYVPINIDSLTFTVPGTYTYQMYEMPGSIAGVSYPSYWATITYTVTQEKDEATGIPTGKLNVVSVVSGLTERTTGNFDAFVNNYNVTEWYSSAVSMDIAKTLTGHDIASSQFEFKIEVENATGSSPDENQVELAKRLFGTDADGTLKGTSSTGKNTGAATLDTSTNTASTTVSMSTLTSLFDQLTFTTADAGKSFTFKVSEFAGEANKGYTYDNTYYEVTIAVSDDDKLGKLTITSTVKKVATDGTTTTVTYLNESGQWVAVEADGEVPSLSYTTGENPDSATLPFANTYTATGTAQLQADKQLTGRSLAASEFKFAIAAYKVGATDEDIANAKDAMVLGSGYDSKNGAGTDTTDASGNTVSTGSIQMPTVTFTTAASTNPTQELANGTISLSGAVEMGYATRAVDATTGKVTYTFGPLVATEDTSASSLPASVTATKALFKCGLVVVDNGDGTLTATITNEDGTTNSATNKVVFTNTYNNSATLGDAVSLAIQKTLLGTDNASWKTAGKFQFHLTGSAVDKDGATVDNKLGTTATITGGNATIASEGTAVDVMKLADDATVTDTTLASILNALEFSTKDSGNVYTYTIDEVEPDGGTNGMSYDGRIWEVKVEPTDDDAGTFTLKVTITAKTSSGATDTTYSSDGFTEGVRTITYTNQSNTSTRTTVESATLGFTNTYSSEVTVEGTTELKGTKTIEGDYTASTYPVFTYTIAPSTNDTALTVTGTSYSTQGAISAGYVVMPSSYTASTTASSLDFNFGDITIKRAGTYTFTVTETTGGDTNAGWTNTAEVKTVVIKAEDNGQGTMTKTVTITGAIPSTATTDPKATATNDLAFTNKYTTTQTQTPATVPWTKFIANVDGTTAETNQSFTFTITPRTNDSAYMDGSTAKSTDDAITNGIIVSDTSGTKITDRSIFTVKLAPDSGGALTANQSLSLSFPNLYFTKVGTYLFDITETDEGSSYSQWSYDKHTYTVKIVVTDDGGQLVATRVELTSEEMGSNTNANVTSFTNSKGDVTTYDAQGALDIVKTLTGATLVQEQFTFELVATSGKEASSTQASTTEAENKLAAAYPTSSTDALVSYSSTDKKLTVKNRRAETLGGSSSVRILQGLEFYGSSTSASDVGKTFTYTVTELTDSAKTGITYDTSLVRTVEITPYEKSVGGVNTIYTVTVVKDASGNTLGTYSSEDGTNTAQVSFTNTYNGTGDLGGEAQGVAKIDANKTLTIPEGSSRTLGAEFNFTVKDSAGNELASGANAADTDSSDGLSGVIDFSKITFTTENKDSYVTTNSDGSKTVSLPKAVEDKTAEHGLTTGGYDTWTFDLIVAEDTTKLPAGVSATGTTSYSVRVVVTANDTSTLTVVVAYPTSVDTTPATSLTFTNEYKTTEADFASADADVTKQVTGRNATSSDTFNFTVTTSDEGTIAAIADGKITGTGITVNGTTVTPGTASVSGPITAGTETTDGVAVSFGTWKFYKEGTYRFTVKENYNGEGDAASNNGWTMDTHTYNFTVTVADSNGQLTAKSEYEYEVRGKNVFKNVYGSSTTLGVAAPVTVTKILNGTDAEANKFSFAIAETVSEGATPKIKDNKAYTSPALTNGAAANLSDLMATLNALEFTQADSGYTFTYAITETTQDDSTLSDGYGYDTDQGVYTLIIQPIDNLDGTMKLTVTLAYKQTPTSAGTTIGTYSFDGKTKAVVPSFGFTNTYHAIGKFSDVFQASIVKTLTGKSMSVNQFSFLIEAIDTNSTYATEQGTTAATAAQTAAVMKLDDDKTSTTISGPASAAADGVPADIMKNALAGMSFDETNVGMTYSVKISEVDGKAEGYTYDGTTYEIRVNVTDTNKDGKLTLTGQVIKTVPATTAGGEPTVTTTNFSTTSSYTTNIAFNNTYEMSGSLDAGTIKVAKVYGGFTWTENMSFSFKLAKGSYTAPAGTSYKVIDDAFPMPVDSSGNVQDTVSETYYTTGAQFGEIKYTVPGTYTYTLSEVDDRTDKTDIAYDTTVYTITVNVVDDGKGNLTATVTNIVDSSKKTYDTNMTLPLTFSNFKPTKAAQSESGAAASSIQVGQTLYYNIAFSNNSDKAQTITVTDTIPTNTTYAGDDKVTATVNGTDVELASTGDNTLSTTKAGDKVTGITVKLSNVAAGASGSVKFAVTVDESAVQGDNVKDGVGTITNSGATVRIGENNPAVKANSTETIVNTASLTLSKLVPEDNSGDKTKAFEFTVKLTAADGTTPLTGTYSYTTTGIVEGGSEGAVAIDGDGQITVKLASGQDAEIKGLPEGAKYTIKEASASGWTAQYYRASGDTAIDEPEGGVTGDVTAGGATVNYVNTYSAQGSLGEGSISVSKSLSGRDWTDGDKFTFEISADEGTPLPVTRTVDVTKNPTTASFGKIDYTQAGTYTYTVKETGYSTTDTSLSYDTTEYTVTVNVTDNGDGTLKAEVTSMKDSTGVETTVTDGTATLSFTNSKPVKTASTTEDKTSGSTVKVGQEITYTIAFDNTSDVVQTINVDDKIPENTTYTGEKDVTVKVNDESYSNYSIFVQPSTGKVSSISVQLNNVPAHASGIVSFRVKVDESAVTSITTGSSNTITNDKATVQIGKDAPRVKATTTTTTVSTVDLPITKKIAGSGYDEDQVFEINVYVKDAGGNALDGSYAVEGGTQGATVDFKPETEGDYKGYGKATITTKGSVDGTTVTIKGLPEGVDYKVAEASYERWNATYASSPDILGTTITNTYTPVDTEPDKEVYVNADASNETTYVDANGKLVGAGDTLTYMIEWTNDAVDSSTQAATKASVTVFDAIPEGTTFAGDVTCKDVVGIDGTTHKTVLEVTYYKDTEGKVVFDHVPSAAEYSQVKAISWSTATGADADANAKGRVYFNVTVNEVAIEAPEDIVNGGATVTIGDNPKVTKKTTNPQPSKTETTNPSEIKVGQTLNYEIKFTADDQASATVVDTLSAGLSYTSGATVTVGDETKTSEPTKTKNSDGTTTLTWKIDGLNAGDSVVVAFSVEVTRAALTTVDNSATVNGHKTNIVTTPVPPDDDKKTYSSNGAVLLDGKIVSADEVVTYKINWAADADVDGDGKVSVTIVDTLPAGVVADKENFTKDAVMGMPSYDKTTNTVTWKADDVTPGARGTVEFWAIVTADAFTGGEMSEVTNTAQVNNHTKVESTVYTPGKSQSVTTGSAAGSAEDLKVGDTIEYTVAYMNDAEDAATVTVTDDIPAGTELLEIPTVKDGSVVAYDGKGGSGNEVTDASKAASLVWTFENVQPGVDNAGTVNFKVRVTQAAVGKTVDNQATINVGEDTPVVTNKTTTSVVETGSLVLSKAIAPEGLISTKQFTFTVELKDASGNALAGTYSYTGSGTVEGGTEGKVDIADGKITAKLSGDQNVTFTDLPEGATYSVSEAAESGWTASAEGLVDGKVSGTISTSVSTVAFTNTYVADPGYLGGRGSARIDAAKTLTGRDLVAEEFEFEVTNITKEGDDQHKATGTNAADGTITFDEIEFTTQSLLYDVASGQVERTIDEETGVCTYSYTYQVEEVVGDLPEGVVAKKSMYQITVTVTDKGDGSALEVGIDYPEGTEDSVLEFVNAYGESASDAVTVSGTKKLDNEVTNAGKDSPVTQESIAELFTFTLTGEDGAPMPEGSTGNTKEAKNDASGNVTFGDIVYTFANVWGDEADDSDTADSTDVAETSEGSDTFESTDASTAESGAEESAPAAGTDANADGAAEAAADTDVEADTAAEDETTADTDVDADAAETAGVSDGTGLAEQIASLFGAQTAEAAPADEAAGATRTKTFTYTITESGSVTWIDNDPQSTRTFKVTVTDNGDGTLSTSVTDEDGNALTSGSLFDFTNAYDVEDYDEDGDPIFSLAQKVLTGRGTALEAKEFEFQLTETVDGETKVISDGWNNAGELDEDGNYTASLTMSAWTYTIDDIGTHTYTFAEVIPEGLEPDADGKYVKDGITYDQTTYTITATIADNGDGTLKADYEIAGVDEGEKMTFTNTYSETPSVEPTDDTDTDSGTTPTKSSSGTTAGKSTASTGDASMLYLLLLGIIGAGCAGVGIARRRRMRGKHSRR